MCIGYMYVTSGNMIYAIVMFKKGQSVVLEFAEHLAILLAMMKLLVLLESLLLFSIVAIDFTH